MTITFTEIASVISAVSVAVGIFFVLFRIQSSLRETARALHALKINSLEHLLPILDRTLEVQDIERHLDSDELKRIEQQAEAMVAVGMSGGHIYHELTQFKAVCHHYERLSSLIKLGYLEFDAIFEVVPFPDQFWYASSQIREVLQDNWYGPGKEMPDFLDNIKWLHENYVRERELRKRVRFLHKLRNSLTKGALHR